MTLYLCKKQANLSTCMFYHFETVVLNHTITKCCSKFCTCFRPNMYTIDLAVIWNVQWCTELFCGKQAYFLLYTLRNFSLDFQQIWLRINLNRVTLMLVQFLTKRSEEHTSELQSPVPISYAVFCLKKKKKPLTLIQLSWYNTHILPLNKH